MEELIKELNLLKFENGYEFILTSKFITLRNKYNRTIYTFNYKKELNKNLTIEQIKYKILNSKIIRANFILNALIDYVSSLPFATSEFIRIESHNNTEIEWRGIKIIPLPKNKYALRVEKLNGYFSSLIFSSINGPLYGKIELPRIDKITLVDIEELITSIKEMFENLIYKISTKNIEIRSSIDSNTITPIISSTNQAIFILNNILFHKNQMTMTHSRIKLLEDLEEELKKYEKIGLEFSRVNLTTLLIFTKYKGRIKRYIELEYDRDTNEIIGEVIYTQYEDTNLVGNYRIKTTSNVMKYHIANFIFYLFGEILSLRLSPNNIRVAYGEVERYMIDFSSYSYLSSESTKFLFNYTIIQVGKTKLYFPTNPIIRLDYLEININNENSYYFHLLNISSSRLDIFLNMISYELSPDKENIEVGIQEICNKLEHHFELIQNPLIFKIKPEESKIYLHNKNSPNEVKFISYRRYSSLTNIKRLIFSEPNILKFHLEGELSNIINFRKSNLLDRGTCYIDDMKIRILIPNIARYEVTIQELDGKNVLRLDFSNEIINSVEKMKKFSTKIKNNIFKLMFS